MVSVFQLFTPLLVAKSFVESTKRWEMSRSIKSLKNWKGLVKLRGILIAPKAGPFLPGWLHFKTVLKWYWCESATGTGSADHTTRGIATAAAATGAIIGAKPTGSLYRPSPSAFSSSASTSPRSGTVAAVRTGRIGPTELEILPD